METYLIKAVMCSSVLIALYYLFLEKEKSFLFNRFYLIFALLFSYVIPLISLKLPAKETPKSGMVFQESVSDMMVIPAQTVESTMDWSLVLISIYACVVFLLLLKSIYSIYKILSLKGNLVRVHGQKTKGLVEEISPFSFMGTLYIGKNYISAENRIDERIFLHERVHITQKHSLDLILIEILKIISWFNPALYFYKKAIVTNHEFLADEHVVSNNFDVPSYQKLILKEISTHNNLQFSNQFNYNNTKKRFIMMTKSNSKFSQLKKVLVVPAMFALAFLFVQKTYASESNIAEVVKKPAISNLNEEILPVINSKINDDKIENNLNILKNDTIKKPNVEKKAVEVNKEVSYKMPSSPSKSALTEVDELPEFPGGFNAFRGLVASSFNGAVLKGDEKLLKTTLSFVIDVDGKVSDVTSEGENEIFNKEATRTAKAVNENQTWKPAMKDGKPVKYKFQMPLVMAFGS